MITMARTKGVFQEWKEEQRRLGIKEGIKEGRKNILNELAKNYTTDEISSMLNMDICEIEKIMKD